MSARTKRPAEKRGVDVVNTYDPMDWIAYRHMDAGQSTYSAVVTGTDAVDRLPSG